ncbi:MAG: RecQ family ATP-dependent DNA helicase [Bacteroidaceae bacterium]|nr:RecQ family ATP-dependent DNA helicase [Bacteroidaceae bacterium]
MDRYLQILRTFWGYDDFRGIQRDIIESIGRGEDTLGLMPTGGGKSITFQVPTMAMDGLCLVISPLISLMQDQVANLRKLGIRAASINMSMGHEEVLTVLESCIFGGYKFLYVSPERLSSDLFQNKLSRMKVCLIAIDEAHCISQWGYDFRPAYLEISKVRELLPGVPVLALTATATPLVVEDIQRQLSFARQNVFRMSFDRKNLVYVVRNTENMDKEMTNILKATTGSAIVYCQSRATTVDVAATLTNEDISATHYHAGLAHEQRVLRQREWTQGKTRVMVATNAFGMGIDKADVRVVIHYGMPQSIEAYYQEAGRAGRDGDTSYAVLLYMDATKRKLRKLVSSSFPVREVIGSVYEHICCFFELAVNDGQDYTRMFDMDKFCVAFRHYPHTVSAVLHLLELSGYIAVESSPDRYSRFMFMLTRNQLYRLDRLSGQGERILNLMMRTYVGLFTDMQNINEKFIAEQTGLTVDEVYMFLKDLASRNIAQYVPLRNLPVIRFTRRRVDTERLIIPEEVYEKRRDAMKERIEAMIGYAEHKGCRSRFMLDYFGEKMEDDCMHCDMCKRGGASQGGIKKAVQALLDNGKALLHGSVSSKE